MSGSDFSLVSSGDPLRISAGFHNETIAALKAERARKLSTAGGALDMSAASVTVEARNDTGQDLARFGIVVLNASLYAVTAGGSAAYRAFLQQHPLKAVKASTTWSGYGGRGVLGVAVGPIKNGQVGTCQVLGVTPAKLRVVRGEARSAGPALNDAAAVQTHDAGTAVIVSRSAVADTNGLFDAVLYLSGAPLASRFDARIIEAVDLTTNQDPRWKYGWVEAVADDTEAGWALPAGGLRFGSASGATYARNRLEANNGPLPLGNAYGHALGPNRTIAGTSLIFAHVPLFTVHEIAVSADVATLAERFAFSAPNPILGPC